MHIVYQFYWDCGRSGYLSGGFVAESEDVNNTLGKSIYFGEVLGKHSEVYGELEKCDLKILSEDQDFIAKFKEIVGSVGYNPLAYLREDQE